MAAYWDRPVRLSCPLTGMEELCWLNTEQEKVSPAFLSFVSLTGFGSSTVYGLVPEGRPCKAIPESPSVLVSALSVDEFVAQPI